MNVSNYSGRSPPISGVLAVVLIVASSLLASPGDAVAEAGPSASIIRATPYFESGHQRGYRLYPRSDPAPYEKLGLEPGDLLLEVDGQPMAEPRAHVRFFERLDTGMPVAVKIWRGAELIELTLQLN